MRRRWALTSDESSTQGRGQHLTVTGRQGERLRPARLTLAIACQRRVTVEGCQLLTSPRGHKVSRRSIWKMGEKATSIRARVRCRSQTLG